ncbi:hypothetical protein V1519DRAFT_450972, partial [Lipomyces tetrasporus]
MNKTLISIALIFDPRFRTELLKAKTTDDEATKLTVEAMKEKLHREYPLVLAERTEPYSKSWEACIGGSHALKATALKSFAVRDIDSSVEEEILAVATTEERWLLRWWRAHKKRIWLAAAMDYLAIPAS